MAHHHLVDCLEALGEYESAHAAAVALKARYPADRTTRLRLALHLYRAGQPRQAAQKIAPLIGDPACRTHSLYRLLSSILAASGRDGEAAAAGARAARLPPDESDWVGTLWHV